jgi:hypothetical protein
VVITPHSSALRVESSQLDAVVSAPINAIRGMKWDGERGVTIELANGDRISGRVAGEFLACDTPSGSTDIPFDKIRHIQVIDASEAETRATSTGEFQLDYAGLRWDALLTGWKVEDGKLASQRYARPGFKYGHWANGRGGLALTGNGDKSWVDYEVTFDYKMLPANREFFHAYIPGESRGMTVYFRAKSVTESWNEPDTCYRLHVSTGAGWSLYAYEDWHMAGNGYNPNNRKGKAVKLAGGKSEASKDATEGTLRIRVHGNTFTIWLNDEQLCKHTHAGEEVSPIPFGGIGVQWRWESMGWISNLHVTNL